MEKIRFISKKKKINEYILDKINNNILDNKFKNEFNNKLLLLLKNSKFNKNIIYNKDGIFISSISNISFENKKYIII